MKSIILSLMILISSALSEEKTGTISGTVMDKNSGNPLIGVNVVVEGKKLGASTDMKGNFEIRNVPVGTYTVKATMLGYEQAEKKRVKVKENSVTKINFKMETFQMDVEEILSPVTSKLEMYAKRDMAAGQASLKFARFPREMMPPHNTEEYSRITESGFLEVIKNPLSTFAADVDAAAYSNARRFIMQDQMPYKDVVRTEEFVNYFNYDYSRPEDGRPLSINMEYSECPWNKDNLLIHIGLQGKRLSREEQKPSNLVFLLDVSGSMNSPKKLPLLKKSFKMLVEQLKENDRVAIAVYAGAAGVVLPPTPGSEKEAIMDALDGLEAGGSTAGGAGLKLAYKLAAKNYIEGGNNRVILATDGDFNVGISSSSELVRFIEEKRDDGIFLTVLGFGMGNYKDYRLQELADRGNGNHAYIDNIMEAKKVLVNDLTATLFTIAKDVKIQVEFNPAKVKSYRLIGYENRELANEDFENDEKDAGEIGAGHTVTALYEIVPADGSGDEYDLRYQQTRIKDNANRTDEILSVKIRYKEPDGDTSKEFGSILKGKPEKLSKTSDNFRFSAAVAEFAMILRDSEFKGSATFHSVRKLAESSKGEDKFGYRAEFLQLVERAGVLCDKDKYREK